MEIKQLLRIRNLTTRLQGHGREIVVAEGLDMDVFAGEILGLIGESGCGKTMTALSLTSLVPPDTQITYNEYTFGEAPIHLNDPRDVRRVRGNGIAYIFQEPSAYLNPLVRIGSQIQETIRLTRGFSSAQAKTEACRCLEEASLKPAYLFYDLYVHQLSGGMSQRAMIALALAQNAKMIVADEPTTALDKSTERSIMATIDKIRRESGRAILWITHDLGLIESLADRILVMYAGRFVETGLTRKVLGHPQHPYTQALVRCLPKHMKEGRFGSIPGAVPDLSRTRTGCLFYPRCPKRIPSCSMQEPAIRHVAPDHGVRCFLL